MIGARQELFHSHKEASANFIARIHSFVELTRRALVYSIGKALVLNDTGMDEIAGYTPRRLFGDPQLSLRGGLLSLPDDIDILFTRYPELRIEFNREQYVLDDTGKLDFKFDTSFEFRLPRNATFTANFIGLEGEGNAGIETFKGEIHDKLATAK